MPITSGGPTMNAGLIAATMALLLASPAVRAADTPPPAAAVSSADGVTVEEVVQLALESNPGIRAARAALAAAKARSGVETSYSDPTFTATWLPQKAAAGKQQSTELMLTQVLPFPGKIGALRQVRNAEEAVSRIALERSIREVTLRVRESAIEIRYLRRAREIAAGNREQLAILRAAGTNAYARDRTGLYDLLRAQSQEAQTVFDGNLLLELEQTEIARLNSLLSRDPDTPVGPIDIRAGQPLSEDLAAIMAFAGSERREVLLAREEANRARAEARVAVFEARPEFMFGVGYMQENALADMDASSRWEFQLGLTLPVFAGKNSSRRAAAAAGVARSEAMEREAADEVRAAVREIYFRLRNAERLVGLYRDALLPQAFASLQLAETWLRAGDGSFADLVDAGTLRYTFQVALARADADREKYLARLESLAERPLTARQATAGPAPVAAVADPAWTAVLSRLESDRAGLERDGAARVLPPGSPRANVLAAAADDDAAAADALFPEITLGDLELLALSRSPLVRSAERSWRAALAQYSQVTAVDDVARRYASATGSLMTGVGGGIGGAMGGAASVRFPFPGMLALKGEIVGADAKAAREDLERARRDALSESRRLYWGLDLAHRSVALLGGIRDIAQQRVSAVQSRYESGQGALADLVQAQIGLELVQTELATAVEERGVTEEGLRALLILPRAATLGLPKGTEKIPAVPELALLVGYAVEQRQELRRMRAMAARMELMIQMTEREVIPGFALEASLFENNPLVQAGTAAVDEPFPLTAGAAEGAGTPKYAFSGRTAGYVRETRERLAALREEIRAEEAASAARVREAWFALDRAHREEQLWAGRIGELTRLAGETLERSYRAGRSTLPEALEAARAARESLLEAARRHAAVGQAWAVLEAAVGAPISAITENPFFQRKD